MKYQDDVYLYASNNTIIELDKLPNYLGERFIKGIPVVFYVHGRGKEPEKPLEKKNIVRNF